MRVMPAGMHHAGVLRGKGQPGLLLHGQGVGIAAQAHGGSRQAAVYHAHGDVGRRRLKRNAQARELPAQKTVRFHLVMRCFGLAVQLAVAGDGLLAVRLRLPIHLGRVRHGQSLPFC